MKKRVIEEYGCSSCHVEGHRIINVPSKKFHLFDESGRMIPDSQGDYKPTGEFEMPKEGYHKTVCPVCGSHMGYKYYMEVPVVDVKEYSYKYDSFAYNALRFMEEHNVTPSSIMYIGYEDKEWTWKDVVEYDVPYVEVYLSEDKKKVITDGFKIIGVDWIMVWTMYSEEDYYKWEFYKTLYFDYDR